MGIRYRALVEDRAHEQLLRGLLDRRGEKAALRVESYPQTKGAAEQRVRMSFPSFVKDLRSKKNQQGLWGLVVIDGDIIGANQRRTELLLELTNAKLSPLSVSDRVLLLVPTRNVETWAWCLLGNPVDETTDFKHLLKHEDLRRCFETKWEPPQPVEPPALVAARAEWARLP